MLAAGVEDAIILKVGKKKADVIKAVPEYYFI